MQTSTSGPQGLAVAAPIAPSASFGYMNITLDNQGALYEQLARALKRAILGAASVAGIDVQVAYRLSLPRGWGSLGFALSGSELIKQTTTPVPGAHTYNCVGLYGQRCLTVNPRWRHNLRVNWETPWDLELTALWRFIGAVSLDTNTSDQSLSDGSYDAFDARMPNMSYLDLSAVYKVIRGVNIRVGINNVFDKDPPIVSANIAAGGAANSFPTYDQLGRELFVAFTLRY